MKHQKEVEKFSVPDISELRAFYFPWQKVRISNQT